MCDPRGVVLGPLSVGAAAIGVVAGLETRWAWLMPAAGMVALAGGLAFVVSMSRRGVAQALSPPFGVREPLTIVVALIAMPVGGVPLRPGHPGPVRLGALEQLATLEGAGYVEVSKSFAGKRPRTSGRLSRTGRSAFAEHVAALPHIAGRAALGVLQT